MPHDAARLNEHAARNLLRGRAMEPREWRASRRLELVELDSVFRSLSPGFASAVAEHGWASPEVAVEVMEAALKYAARI